MWQSTGSDDALIQAPQRYGLALLLLAGTAGALVPLFWPHQAGMVDVSFCSATTRTLGQFDASSVGFGDIAPGSCTPYQRLRLRDLNPTFHVIYQTERSRFGPEDHSGGWPLCPPDAISSSFRSTNGGFGRVFEAHRKRPARHRSSDHDA